LFFFGLHSNAKQTGEFIFTPPPPLPQKILKNVNVFFSTKIFYFLKYARKCHLFCCFVSIFSPPEICEKMSFFGKKRPHFQGFGDWGGGKKTILNPCFLN
jgi:hypothetical protein